MPTSRSFVFLSFSFPQKASQKKFVQADKNGKAEWICIVDDATVLPLLAHESRKSLDEITSRDCISARLELKRDSAQVTCRCKVEDIVVGGAGTSIQVCLFCFCSFSTSSHRKSSDGIFSRTSSSAILETRLSVEFSRL